ncbi:MAG: hypothetical protein RM049_31760 [Nostoc sp. DedQUE04]|nr:hypothetical protein [Nostoc sp. DedQUE04]MDZ8139814.1 hypothetical protein [Nostoc sp. DedQUE04]
MPPLLVSLLERVYVKSAKAFNRCFAILKLVVLAMKLLKLTRVCLVILYLLDLQKYFVGQ